VFGDLVVFLDDSATEAQARMARLDGLDGGEYVADAMVYAGDPVDGLETGWTDPHVRDGQEPEGPIPTPCQGEGRGFESRLPLQ